MCKRLPVAAVCLAHVVVRSLVVYCCLQPTNADLVWSVYNNTVISSSNVYNITTSEVDPAQAAVDGYPKPPRNVRVTSSLNAEWQTSIWITMTVSWESRFDTTQRLRGFEIEVRQRNVNQTWHQYFQVMSSASIATKNTSWVRFQYSCVVGQFVINTWYEYHVRVYSLPRPHSPLGDRYNSRIVRIVNPWRKGPAFWSPQLIAVANDSCSNVVRVDFTLAPLAFNINTYTLCLNRLGLDVDRCVSFLRISPDIRLAFASATFVNVSFGAYNIYISAENPTSGEPRCCWEIDWQTNQKTCPASGCLITRSAAFTTRHPATLRCSVADEGSVSTGRLPDPVVVGIVAGVVVTLVLVFILVVYCIYRPTRHVRAASHVDSGDSHGMLSRLMPVSPENPADV